MGGLMGSFTSDVTSSFPMTLPAGMDPQSHSFLLASIKQAQALTGGPLVQARNFAVMTRVNAGITRVMKRIRGVEDVQSNMVAAFGSGAMFSLVSGMGGSNRAANALTFGVFFALVQGVSLRQVKSFLNHQQRIYIIQNRSMLTHLGLQNYEKNFKKGLLNDSILPLLTDSVLRDVEIPPGPRLLILDHIQR